MLRGADREVASSSSPAPLVTVLSADGTPVRSDPVAPGGHACNGAEHACRTAQLQRFAGDQHAMQEDENAKVAGAPTAGNRARSDSEALEEEAFESAAARVASPASRTRSSTNANGHEFRRGGERVAIGWSGVVPASPRFGDLLIPGQQHAWSQERIDSLKQAARDKQWARESKMAQLTNGDGDAGQSLSSLHVACMPAVRLSPPSTLPACLLNMWLCGCCARQAGTRNSWSKTHTQMNARSFTLPRSMTLRKN